VGGHSYQVCSICLWLLHYHEQGADPAFQAGVLRHAIEHDQDEAITGDKPAYTKGNGTATPGKILDQSKLVVKCADLLDMHMWCWEDFYMGNELIHPIIQDIERRFLSYWPMFHWDEGVYGQKPGSIEILEVFRDHLRIPELMHPGIEKQAKGWLDALR
jgi:hypothetical protein